MAEKTLLNKPHSAVLQYSSTVNTAVIVLSRPTKWRALTGVTTGGETGRARHRRYWYIRRAAPEVVDEIMRVKKTVAEAGLPLVVLLIVPLQKRRRAQAMSVIMCMYSVCTYAVL